MAGQGRQGERIRADEHLAVAIADRERAAAPGADQEIVPAGEQEDEREGAFEACEGLRHRLCRVETL